MYIHINPCQKLIDFNVNNIKDLIVNEVKRIRQKYISQYQKITYSSEKQVNSPYIGKQFKKEYEFFTLSAHVHIPLN